MIMPREKPTVTHPEPAPSTPYSHLIPSQTIAVVSSFDLSSGDRLDQVPVAYRTWGKLNARADNCMVICHALTGSSDVEDWWGPLMGPNLAFDPSRYFVFCANVLGSPYGTASPVSINPATGRFYGPDFPQTTSRDDVRLQRLVLEQLGVRSVAVVIGGSMGGMATLEWPLCTPPGFVRHIVTLATSPRHSAWGISWGEAQRQSIFSDPKWQGGRYDPTKGEDQPKCGLAAARMAALLTYRSRDSFESRFGRREQPSPAANGVGVVVRTPEERAQEVAEAAARDGVAGDPPELANGADSEATAAAPESAAISPPASLPHNHSSSDSTPSPPTTPKRGLFSAQSYLRYQGTKFTSRFDANCYVHLSRKMDAHDVDADRDGSRGGGGALAWEPEGALVVAISSDGLFTMSEQEELARGMKGAELVVVQSPDGHDGFLLEFEQINGFILEHLRKRLPDVYEAEPLVPAEAVEKEKGQKKESLFGEVEGESVTTW